MVEPFEVRWSSPQASCSALWARPAHPFLSHQTGGWGIPVGFLAHLLGPGSGNTLGFLRQGIQDQGWFPCSLQLSQRSEDPPTCSAGDTGDAGLIPGSGRPPGVGTVNPLHYACLENLMDRGASTAHGVAKSRTQLSAWRVISHSWHVSRTLPFIPSVSWATSIPENESLSCSELTEEQTCVVCFACIFQAHRNPMRAGVLIM